MEPIRWSQIVRTPGSTEVQWHQATEVPPMGSEPPVSDARPGLRLFTRPVGATPFYPTIDVTSSAAQAMLEGFLRTGRHVGKCISWQSRGYGVRRKDTIHIRPLQPGE
jgi:hypothetical protein